jgi:SAM-dependent methyltransferase
LLHAGVPDLLLGVPGCWNIQTCSACASLWLDPSPVVDDLPIAYKGYVTHSPGVALARPDTLLNRARAALQQQLLGYPARASTLERALGRLLEFLPARRQYALRELLYTPWREGGRLLEIGCGNGRQLERFGLAGWQTTGIDFDATAVQTARALGLDVRPGDLAAQRFEDASFDAIVMSHVIEHVPAPDALLAECRRVLRPGGSITVVTPNARALGHRVYGRHWLGLDPPRHLHVLSARGLEALIGSAGFDVVRLATDWVVGPSWFLATRLRRDAELRGGHAGLPAAGQWPPVAALSLVALEALGCEVGAGWGEELVLLARKAGSG